MLCQAGPGKDYTLHLTLAYLHSPVSWALTLRLGGCRCFATSARGAMVVAGELQLCASGTIDPARQSACNVNRLDCNARTRQEMTVKRPWHWNRRLCSQVMYKADGTSNRIYSDVWGERFCHIINRPRMGPRMNCSALFVPSSAMQAIWDPGFAIGTEGLPYLFGLCCNAGSLAGPDPFGSNRENSTKRKCQQNVGPTISRGTSVHSSCCVHSL
ncbi:hypothetical protein BKA67DRAFT_159625 [Truncatella angustata]|uniref:Uncharacterized protein n=1 Tax=Truncatella angustata TaxID=152316 RepID=A0A9P8UQQ5_9PEZI|nr:uncharacterized protein BKA67DRAFT_159625 [Truncatella angustata]KAH6656576.1 hypothetical protein BKA67DRAFT_159625 [Truncatella angustata]